MMVCLSVESIRKSRVDSYSARQFHSTILVFLRAIKSRRIANTKISLLLLPTDRKSVVWGKSVDLGGRRIIKKKKKHKQT